MSFEQHLRPAFDNLTVRLRSDMERHLDAAIQELSAQAAQLAQVSQTEREQAIADAVRDAQAFAEQSAAERQRALLAEAEGRVSDAQSRLDDVQRRLTDAENRLNDAEVRHQEERRQAEAESRQAVADALANATQETALRADAALEEARSEHQALLERTVSEYTTRIEQTIAETESRTLSSVQAADLASGVRLVDAFRTIDKAQTLTQILNVLADAIAAETVRSAIFLAGHDKVKSWRTNGFDGGAPMEVPLEDAGLIAAALASRESASAGGDGGDDSAAKAPAFAGLSDDRGAIAVPMLVNDEVVAVVYADQGPDGDIDRASWACIVELLARHACRSLEAITAHRLATTLGAGVSRPRAVSKPADVVRAAPTSAAARASAAEVDEDSAAAQRLAHALIADIRASHELDVLAGVRDRDLMTRLGGPISRAWAQYEERVPEAVRTATNYFHAEMVRTLANGDASLLTPKP